MDLLSRMVIFVTLSHSSMGKLIIRRAQKEDIENVYQLVAELALFEKALHKHTIDLQQFKDDYDVFYHCVIAERASKMIGMAVYYWGYSTWAGKMLYLEDLVITEQHRKSGVGSQLFNEIIAIAHREGAAQVRWQVYDWNHPAIGMYEKVNANFYSDLLTCKLEREAIVNYRPI